MVPDRSDALNLLKEHNSNTALINHALAVEATMRHFAKKYNQDEEKWGIIGLIHDLDYEKYPALHCQKSKEMLEEHNWPPEYIRAVLSHGWEICTDVKPETDLEKTLYTVDELTGLIAAVALVRPSKSIMDVTLKSVKKKWNQKSFAAGANREIIEKGAAMMEIEINLLIEDVILAMQKVSKEIGL